MPTPTLPIQALLPNIQASLAQHNRVILQAEPGAGKSTQVPLHLMNAPWLKGQKIILLEPRRLAVRALAGFLSAQLGEKIGQRVGYQVRNDRKLSSQTQLEIMTEGVLVRRIQQDPELTGVGLIIFDEFHERALEADLALALTLECQTELREELKILLMSATLESDALSTFLSPAPVIQCPGRSFPVHRHYLPKPVDHNTYGEPYKTLMCLLNNVVQNHAQDCLIFLPGQKEIMTAIRHAQEILDEQKFSLLPLYGGLSAEAQSAVLQKDTQHRRKIIFATNIAETSLTIEGIDSVIDSGLVRKAIYDSSSGMTRMVTQKISKASAKQRSGRAGRLSVGHAYCLWTESEQQQKADFEAEAMLMSDLSDLTLEVAMWGESSPYHLRWLTPPPKAHYEIAKQLLIQLGFLTPPGNITSKGALAAQLGLSSRLANMLLSAPLKAQQMACDLAAILSERDLFKHSREASHGINIEDRLQALQLYRNTPKQAIKTTPIIPSVAKEALKNSAKWHNTLVKMKLDTSVLKFSPPLSDTPSIGQLVALAYPDRIAKRRSNQESRYQLSNGKGTVLRPHDPLVQEPWLVVAHLDGQRREGQAYMACAITLSDIKALFSPQITEDSSIKFDAKKQRIQGTKTQKLGAITLQESVIKTLSPRQVQSCLINTLKTSGLKQLPWSEKSLGWLNRVRWLAQHMPEFQGFSEQALIDDFDHWCAPYLTHIKAWHDLAKLDVLSLLKARLNFEQLNTLEREAPSVYTAPSTKRVAIQYQMGKPPYVAIQLQELFGETRSPCLANGKIPLTFELLSPARQPIQITSDLAHFWQTPYIQ
ncbi:MAG: ATP-dependent helicase HrpB, partial [Thiomicrorhabdus sp.]|nr:ATP-dependent helicase HrpB [Thiomicrorhabdus sp.]